jgi:hypothetical protein
VFIHIFTITHAAVKGNTRILLRELEHHKNGISTKLYIPVDILTPIKQGKSSRERLSNHKGWVGCHNEMGITAYTTKP